MSLASTVRTDGIAAYEPTLDWILEFGPPHAAALARKFIANRQELLDKWGDCCPSAVVESRFAGFFALRAAIVKIPDKVRVSQAIGPALFLGGSVSLAPLVGKEQVTALVSPNDMRAFGLHLNWLKNYPLQTPRDISIISFDNHPFGELSALTTVDPGFGNLGYQAFHAILGAIPIRRDRTGSIRAIPTVVNRRSVGAIGPKSMTE